MHGLQDSLKAIEVIIKNYTYNLLCSVVLLPPLHELVQVYQAPLGSDPYSSEIPSCTGTEGKCQKLPQT